MFYKMIIILLLCISISGYATKNMKEFGGNLAFSAAGGHPVTVGVAFVVGTTIYGTAALIEVVEEGNKTKIKDVIETDTVILEDK